MRINILLKRCFATFFLWVMLSQALLAQENPDSVKSALDSLLTLKIVGEQFVSTASTYAQSVEEAPTSATIITAEDIKLYGYNSLTDVLRTVRGFYASYDRQYESLGIRGFNRPTDYNNRVLLMIDGHRLNIYDGAPIGNDLALNMANFEKIEIIRGPGSALYGQNAMFAVINLITKKTNNFLKPEVKLSYGSFDSKTFSINYGGNISDDLSLSINSSFYDSKGENLYFPEFDKPSTNYGVAENLDFENYYGFNGLLKYKNLQLSILSTYRKKGNPTGSFYSKFNTFSETEERKKFIEAKYTQSLSFDKHLTLRAFYDTYYQDGTYHIYVLFIDDVGTNQNDFETAGGEGQFIWDVLNNNRITMGIEYRHDLMKKFRLFMPNVYELDIEEPNKTLSIYVQDEYQYSENLSFYAGLRRDDYFNGEFSVNPRFSINYAPHNNHILKLIYGTAYRTPNIYERNYEIPLLFKKNNYLQAEKITTIDFIWEYDISKIFKNVFSFYHYDMTDLIDQYYNPSEFNYQFRNIGKAKATGIELGGQARVSENFRGYASYSYQYAQDGNNKRLTNSPENIFKSGCYYKFENLFSTALEFQYETERLTVKNTRTNSFFYSTLFINSEFDFYGIKFSLLIKNLFDNSIYYPAGLQNEQKSFLQPGRTFSFNLTYGFN